MPQLFDLRPAALAFETAFLRGQRAAGWTAHLRPGGRLPDERHQPVESIAAVLLLGAETAGFDDKHPIRGYALACQVYQAAADLLGK